MRRTEAELQYLADRISDRKRARHEWEKAALKAIVNSLGREIHF